ncbi:methyl-accepting chemotaxis protein [Calditrichota bacterium GD2]
MWFSRQNIRNKVLLLLIPTILFMIIAGVLIIRKITLSALDQNLQSSHRIIGHLAVEAVKTGVEFGDRDLIKEALSGFVRDRNISSVRVYDDKGDVLFAYGIENVSHEDAHNDDELWQSNNNLFLKLPVTSGGKTIGKVIVGQTLKSRNKALYNATNILLLLSVLGVLAIIIFLIKITQKITRPLTDLKEAALRLSEGQLEAQITYPHQDELGALVEAFQKMSQALNQKANAARALAKGDIEVEIETLSENDVLGNALNEVKGSLKEMVNELEAVITHLQNGSIEARCEVSQLSGVYAEVLANLNHALDMLTNPIKETIGILNEYARGNLERSMKELPGDLAGLTVAITTIQTNLKALITESIELVEQAKAGNLKYRSDAQKLEGAYRQILHGFNQTLEAMTGPVNEIKHALQKLAEGDLRAKIEADHPGDYGQMKDALNQSLKALNEVLASIATAVEQMQSGANQVADSSQAVSQGATEQASSLQETTASIEEIASQARQNSENAAKANEISSIAQKAAEEGNRQMAEMLQAMQAINDSSSQIYRVIKVIDEIAFQTNLLALNAAVEAARAGVHGKGFAVVAEEVRNLAQRSAKAAKETEQLIENSTQKVKYGSEIANQTASALQSIIQNITSVSDLIDEITSASAEQAEGIEQIRESLKQIDNVTQANAASAEQSAAAADELSSQATYLQKMIGHFKLTAFKLQESVTAADHYRPVEVGQGRKQWPGSNGNGNIENNGDIFDLNDDDFGEF